MEKAKVLELPVIQIAGILDEDEAHMIADCGATHIGFPLRLPVNRPDTTEERAAEIISRLPAGIEPVLITYLARASAIAAFCQKMDCRTVQLHGPVPIAELARLRALDPQLTIFKSLVIGERGSERDVFAANRLELSNSVKSESNEVTGEGGNERGMAVLERMCLSAAPFVDAFITDTYDPSTGASGATGMVHDWTLSGRLVERSRKPVILAGGLTADNVSAGIETTRVSGVDSHTGVEGADGRKDRVLVAGFVNNARAAFTSLS